MGFTDYADAVRAFFNTHMSANAPNVSVAWENVDNPSIPPTVGAGNEWVRFTLRGSTNFDISPGWRNNFGVVIVQCFTDLDIGPGACEDVAEIVASGFRQQRFLSGAGDFSTPRLDPIGPDGEGWYQCNVTIPFFHQEAA